MKISDNRATELERLGWEDQMKAAINAPEREGIKHPFYNFFVTKCRAMGIRDEKIKELWMMLLHGYQLQGNIVAAAKADKTINTIGEYLGRINDNQHFKRFVNEFCANCNDALAVLPQEKLALWSGGYAVSEIAQKLGYCTLEKTKLGQLMNTLEGTTEWDQELALWNILSMKFVDEYRGDIIHIYFRNVDELCVLFQQEIPMIKTKSNTTVIWHPLMNNGDKIAEVGRQSLLIDVERKANVFNCEAAQVENYNAAFDALEDKLRGDTQRQNQFTKTHFRSKDFCPVRAPFAREEITKGALMNDFLNKFWE